jgi:hypothetical protein
MTDEQQATDALEAPAEEIVVSLRRRAAELWGPERAGQLSHVFDDVARDIRTVSKVQLSDVDEPAFYPH